LRNRLIIYFQTFSLLQKFWNWLCALYRHSGQLKLLFCNWTKLCCRHNLSNSLISSTCFLNFMPNSEMINLSERLTLKMTWQWATQRMYCYRQEIPTLPDHMGSPFSIKSPVFVYCVLSVAFFVVDCFCSSQVLIVSLFIDFWLPLWFFFTIFYNKIMLYPFPTIIMSRHEIKDKKIILSYWYTKTIHITVVNKFHWSVHVYSRILSGSSRLTLDIFWATRSAVDVDGIGASTDDPRRRKVALTKSILCWTW
jgi:hypothetical protein